MQQSDHHLRHQVRQDEQQEHHQEGVLQGRQMYDVDVGIHDLHHEVVRVRIRHMPRVVDDDV